MPAFTTSPRRFALLAPVLLTLLIGAACTQDDTSEGPPPGTVTAQHDATSSAGGSATPALVEETEYVSEALGVSFRYPADFDPPDSACHPIEDATQVLLGNNVGLAVFAARATLDDAVAQELQRISAREERREIGRLGDEEAITVDYRIENSGRAGTSTFAIRGDRLYRLTVELRNPDTCAGIDAFSIYAGIRESLRFLD